MPTGGAGARTFCTTNVKHSHKNTVSLSNQHLLITTNEPGKYVLFCALPTKHSVFISLPLLWVGFTQHKQFLHLRRLRATCYRTVRAELANCIHRVCLQVHSIDCIIQKPYAREGKALKHTPTLPLQQGYMYILVRSCW